MHSGVAQKLPSTLTKDAGRLVDCSKCMEWTGNSKVPATDGCGCPLHTQFAGGSRPQMPTSSKLNHRLAKLSQIWGGGARPRRHSKRKGSLRTLNRALLRESTPQKSSGMTRVLKGSHSFTNCTCTPTRSFAIGICHTCLCLPS